MHKIYVLLLSLWSLGAVKSSAKNTIDSIGVENHKGNKVILHKVEAKETYYAISRRYKIPYQEIMTYNNNKMLDVGVIIKVPTRILFNTASNTSENVASSTENFEYFVQKKDNLMALAKRYGTTVNEIKKLSGLSSINLQIGQKLIIPGKKTEDENTSTTEKTKEQNPIIVSVVEKTNSPTNNTTTYTVKKKDNLNLIAKNLNVSVDEIKRLNGLTSNNLQIGQVLQISTAPTAIQTDSEENQQSNETENIKKTSKNTIKANGFEYIVAGNENIYSVANKFNITTFQIQQANNLTGTALKPGQKIIIPTGKPVTQNKIEIVEKLANENEKTNRQLQRIKEKAENEAKEKEEDAKKQAEKALEKSNKENGFEYKVANNETIYSIAKKFNITTYQIQKSNNLTSTELKPGQKIIINTTKPIIESTGINADSGSNTFKNPNLKYPANRYGLTQFEEKGAAMWMSDADLDASKMLVLHRTAPVGTVIKITNPMSNRSTFAKVVGKFTENESTKDVIIVMTKAVAEAVGALDKRFFCNLTYGAPESIQ
jgi:peptidoglycan endopeptidase LytF